MRWLVYMVRCNDGSLYTGITLSITNRIFAHNRGQGAKYTRSRRLVKLAYLERGHTVTSAKQREHAIKQLSRRQKESLINKWKAST